jgi:hypothetical protein
VDNGTTQKGKKGVHTMEAIEYEEDRHNSRIANVTVDGFERVVRLEQKINDVEANLHKYHTNSIATTETLRTDMDKRMVILETTADTTKTLCQKTNDEMAQMTRLIQQTQTMQVQAMQSQPLNYPKPTTMPQMMPQLSSFQANGFEQQMYMPPQYQTTYQQQQMAGYGKGPNVLQPRRGGKGDGKCFICQMPGHIARFCPNKTRQSRQYVGSARVAAVAGEIRGSAQAYDAGGTQALSASELHVQMGDSSGGEINAADILCIACNFADDCETGASSEGEAVWDMNDHSLDEAQVVTGGGY